jgi:hypothetical protein
MIDHKKFPPMLLALVLCAHSERDWALETTGVGFLWTTLSPDEPATIPLMGRMAVILDVPPHSFSYTLLTSQLRVVPHTAPYPYRHLLLLGESVNLTASREPVRIGVWLLPLKMCGRGSMVLGSADHLHLTSDPLIRDEEICVFAQPDFRSAKMAATVSSSDPNAEVEFFDTHGTARARVIGKVGEKCQFADKDPFFLRVSPIGQGEVSFAIEYEVEGPTVKSCSVLSVPVVKADGVEASVTPPVHFSCNGAWSGNILNMVGIAGVMLFIAVWYQWKMQRVVEWTSPDRGNKG